MSTPWQGSNRRARLPPDWPRLRARILERDGHQCTWTEAGERCTARATDVDHDQPGDNHGDSNLRSLCAHHHKRKTAAEAALARAAMPRRRRPAEPHPGMQSDA